MSTTGNSFIRIVGRLTLFVAAIFLVLFLANLRSRLYYHGPNYSFLLWMFFYCLLTGIGLLKLRKWAVLLLFLPGVLPIAIFVYSWTKGASVPMPWALVNYGFLAALFAIPVFMLRKWYETSMVRRVARLSTVTYPKITEGGPLLLTKGELARHSAQGLSNSVAGQRLSRNR
jgi:hypothetical protein